MTPERPSPFTIPQPQYVFDEGTPSEPVPAHRVTVGGLIRNLIEFADFYEQATAAYERDSTVLKLHKLADRDTNADQAKRQFLGIQGIHEARAYLLRCYSEELTISSARRLLGDLIRIASVTVEAAEAMPLDEAMERLGGTGREARNAGHPPFREEDGAAGKQENHTQPPKATICQPKKPTAIEMAVWRHHKNTGQKQIAMADDPEVMSIIGKKWSQGQISRCLKKVDDYLQLGGVEPDEELARKPTPIDPSRIEMGSRRDKRNQPK